MSRSITAAVAISLISATPAAALAATTPTVVKAAVASTTRYCVLHYEEVGTHIVHRKCMTREHWLDIGYDPISD